MINLAPKLKYRTIFAVKYLRLFASGTHEYLDRQNWLINSKYIQNE